MALTWGQFFDSIAQTLGIGQKWYDQVESKGDYTMDHDDKLAHKARKLSRANAKKARAGRTSSFKADTPINDLALAAANWLADNWPDESGRTGRGVFVAQRFQEIIGGTFPAKYWEPCPLIAEQTRKCYPTVTYDAPQPPAKFVTPGSKNSRCRYTSAVPDSGNAGNAGHTRENGFFVDDYSKQKNYKFQIPEPAAVSTTRPLFARQECTFHVAYTHQNRQSFSNLFKASVAPDGAAFSLEDQAVDATGRFYYWHKATPKADPATLIATMPRTFVIDAGYKQWNDGYTDSDGGQALIQVAPAPPRGTYRYKSLSVFVDQQNHVDLYVGKSEQEDDPEPTPGGFVFEIITGDYCDTRPVPGTLPTYDATFQIYLAAQSALDTSKLAAVLKFWREFRPDDPIPGLPGSLSRVRFSHAAWESGNTCKPYNVGGAGLWTARPLQVLTSFQRDWFGGDRRSPEAIAAQDYDHHLTWGATHYFAGASGWRQHTCMKDPAFWNDKFRVHLTHDRLSISWSWDGVTGAAYWRPGDPWPIIPPRPAPP